MLVALSFAGAAVSYLGNSHKFPTLVVMPHAGASASEKVGEFTASGFLFKDSVEVVTVEDPDGAPIATAFHQHSSIPVPLLFRKLAQLCLTYTHVCLCSAWCALVYKRLQKVAD